MYDKGAYYLQFETIWTNIWLIPFSVWLEQVSQVEISKFYDKIVTRHNEVWMDRPCTGQAKFISSCSAMTDLYDKWRQSIVSWTHKTPYQSNCQIVYIAGGYNESHKSKSHTSLSSDTPPPINQRTTISCLE